jgi:hypothetical protein
MPGPEVTKTDSRSDKQPLYSSMDGESDNSEASASAEKAKRNSGKKNANRSSPISKPKIRAGDEKRAASILSSASSPTGKSQGSPKGNIGNGASPKRNSSSANRLGDQQKIPLLMELDNSWESSEKENVPSHQGQGQANLFGTSSQVNKTSQPALRITASSGLKPLGGTQSKSTVKLVNMATEQGSSLVESSSEQTPDVALPSRTIKQKALAPAPAKTADPVKKRASMPDVSQPLAKLAKGQTHGGFLSEKPVQKQKAKAVKDIKQQRLESLTPDAITQMDAHKVDLIALMTSEDTDENAEELYQQVARICTDKNLKNWQKLECLRGEVGKVCTTLTQDVNAYFEAWVIQHYVDNHAPNSKVKNAGNETVSNVKEERKSLLSDSEDENDDGNIAVDKRSVANPNPEYDQKHVLEKFRSTLSWWERRKLEKIKPEEKFAKDPGRKAALQRIELLRKMQKRLTTEERKFIRDQTKTYHDLLANSGLPVLHIAVKNESCKLVRAYLLAVMAFAPFDIKKEAIQATQHQGLQAFYWAMTHSTTDMIKMFMETVLKSEFLFYKEKKEILHARRPDPQKNGIYGISGFYMAMASGDIARADAFMSQLLEWDPNCRTPEYSEIKIDLLEGFKSRWIKDKAKGAAVENGHKALVEKYNQYVNSSHLRRIEKDLLFKYNKIQGPEERQMQLASEQENEQGIDQERQQEIEQVREETQRLIQEVFKTFNLEMYKKDGGLPKDVEVAPGVPKQGHTKTHQIIAHERRRSILELNNQPVPEHLKRKSIRDRALRPFRNLDEAGDYAKLSTIPEPIQDEKRRKDGDYLLGSPPAVSEEARGNSWQERKENHTLPPRSSSYASGLVDLPPVPASMPALPRLDELSPIKLTPSPRRRFSQNTGLSNGTPTRLVTEKAGKPSSTSGSSSIRKKNLQKHRSSTGADSIADALGAPIPS